VTSRRDNFRRGHNCCQRQFSPESDLERESQTLKNLHLIALCSASFNIRAKSRESSNGRSTTYTHYAGKASREAAMIPAVGS